MASGDSKVVDLADLNPEFRRRMGNFLTAAKAAGYPAHIIEAYRDRAVQAQYYAEHQQGLRPYPVAPPGTSFHEGGFAADTLTDDRSQQSKLIAFANAHPEFGIAPLPGDAPHFQISGYRHLADAIKNPPKLGEGPSVDLSPFIATNQGYSIASGYKPGSMAATNTTQPRANFLGALAQIESNNQNIFSGVDKDYPGQPGSRSQGYYQIDTPTWQQFAAKAGIDVSKYPSAMNAPPEVQAQVASLIPLSRFGERTQRMLGQQFGQLDTSKTIGELAQGTTLNSTPATGGTAVAAAPAAPTFGESIAKGDVGGAIKAAFTVPTTKDAQGNDVQGKSPLEKIAGAFGGDKQRAAPEIPAMPQAMPAQDPNPGLAPAAQQLFSTVQANAARPLTWNARPYGYNAGFQGTTLNATDYGNV